MARLPPLEPREVVASLRSLGFEQVRQRGSHEQIRHADGRATTVPFRECRGISLILLRKISRDVGVPIEDLLRRR